MKVILTSALRTGTHWLIEILSDLLETNWTFHKDLKDAKKEDFHTLIQVHNIEPEKLVDHFDKVIAITRNSTEVIASRKKFEAHWGNEIPIRQILYELRKYETDFKHEKYLKVLYRHLQQIPIIMMRRIANFLGTMHSDRELFEIWTKNKMGSNKWREKMYIPRNVHGAELY